jgi:transcriptional regulator with XRE-family HTH domain
MVAPSGSPPDVVRINRLHPFRLWLLNSEKTQEWAADALGVSRVYLTKVLSGRKVPSRELYADMARLSKGGLTIRELEAFRKPSERPRRLQPKPRRKRQAAPVELKRPQRPNGLDS